LKAFGTEMSLLPLAIKAFAAAWDPVESHPVSNPYPVHVLSYGNYFASTFMAQNARNLSIVMS
tara:strand:- start:428 stop:616 length:189 start_codon:yes stop_codon:yes gene_type:complete